MRGTSGFFGDALIICGKDLRIELRTGEIFFTAAFFAALIVIVASISFFGGVTALVPIGNAVLPWNGTPLPDGAMVRVSVQIAPGAIWLSVTFASILALGRTWQRERDDGALTGLLVSPISRAAIFAGKALGVAAFMFAVECVVVPLVALFFAIDLTDIIGALAAVLVLGTIGVASAGTLFGAMTARTRARDLVLALVLFPLLLPALLCSVSATHDIITAAQNVEMRSTGALLWEIRGWLGLLGVFDAMMTIGGIALFGALVDD